MVIANQRLDRNKQGLDVAFHSTQQVLGLPWGWGNYENPARGQERSRMRKKRLDNVPSDCAD